MAVEMNVNVEIPGLREYVDKWVEEKNNSFHLGQVVDTDALMAELQDAVKEYINANRIIRTEVIPRTVEQKEKRDNPYVSKLEKRNE